MSYNIIIIIMTNEIKQTRTGKDDKNIINE